MAHESPVQWKMAIMAIHLHLLFLSCVKEDTGAETGGRCHEDRNKPKLELGKGWWDVVAWIWYVLRVQTETFSSSAVEHGINIAGLLAD